MPRFVCLLVLLALCALIGLGAAEVADQAPVALDAAAQGAGMPWWAWVLILLVSCFGLGIFATLGGVGGGVLFVPIVGGFFPFHMDYVRCAGLLIALSGALAAAPSYLRQGLASFRLAMPGALIASSFSIVGALVGLALPGNVVRIALGITILAIVAIMLRAKRSDYPDVGPMDSYGRLLGVHGTYFEASERREVTWHTHRNVWGLSGFVVVGLIAGMFGLGAGWANVPLLNLLMGAPLKISVATSGFLLSITDTSAAWIYLNGGAMLPIIVIPSLVGMIAGARIGALLLPKVKPASIRRIVLGLMIVAGLRSLLRGLEIW